MKEELGTDMEKDAKRTEPITGSGKKHRSYTRRLVQLYAALLYNANLKGFIDGHIYSGSLKSVCVPGFNCYSCPGAIASCPLGSLQNALNASGHTAPWYMLGILALFGVVLGRTVCGWLCPLGLIQELLHKLPVPKIKKSVWTRRLSYLKYVFLVVFVIAIPIWFGINKGLPYPGFCKFICPAGTLEGAVGLLQNEANATSFYQLKILFTRKWVIMLVIGLACAFCYRTFCRFLCPLGAIYGFFNRFALTLVKVDPDRCNGCGLCVRRCQMDVKHVGDHECISCGKCMESCAQGAISIKAGSITLAGPVSGKNADPEPVIQRRRKIGRIIWGAAIAVLLFALVWFNWIEPSREKAGQVKQEENQTAASGTRQTENAASAIETDSESEMKDSSAQAFPVKQEENQAAASGTRQTENAASAIETDSEGAEQDLSAKADSKSEELVSSALDDSQAGEEAAIHTTGAAADRLTDQAASGKTGTKVGDILPDFQTDLLGGGEFHLADYRGQVVILNFWAITCAPCIEELPYYEELKEEQPEVEILAIHHRVGAKKAEDFLADKGWDHLDFALDSKEKGIYTLLEASDALPQTIVLDQDGRVIYNAQTPLTLEQLKELVKQGL